MKDIGWGFLNSGEDDYFIVDEDIGYGCTYSDGSAIYRGKDGSYGDRYSDGSITYHGADGSYGNRYSDGYGSYTDSSGNTTYYNKDDTVCNHSSEDSNSTFSDLILLGGAAVLFSHFHKKNQSTKQEEKDDEELSETNEDNDNQEYYETDYEQKPKVDSKKEIKLIFLPFIIILLFLSIFGAIEELRKFKKIDCSKNDLIGVNYKTAKSTLTDKGFTHIKCHRIDDLEVDNLEKNNVITNIYIDGEKYDFDNKRIIKNDTKIILEYHSIKKISFPYSSKSVKKFDWKKVKTKLNSLGFSNIKCKSKKDLIVGVLHHKGEVDSVTIDEKNNYSKGDKIKANAEIVITYHTYK